MRIPSETLIGQKELLAKRQEHPPPSSSPSPSPSSSLSASSTTSPTPSSSATAPPSSKNGSSSSTKTIAVVVTIAAALLVVNVIVFFYLRKIRRRNAPRRTGQTHWLREKWQIWNPKARFGKGAYSPSLQRNELSTTVPQDEESPRNTARNTNRRSGASNVETSQRASVASSNVGRNTSIRSIMTLPAYTPSVRPDEQVLGREGERSGIDTVVEFPETVDEEEARREDEMESLYQIRLQRRRENSAREDRRRLRREARSRGDLDEVNRLRRESRLQADTHDPTSAAAMIIEHQSRGRDRRVSSVSYAGAGVARHDGSRLRANSAESSSDRNPLLSSAASMGSGSGSSPAPRPRTNTATTLSSSIHTGGQHHRNVSSNSVLSQTTTIDDNDDPRHDDDYGALTLAPTRTRASSMTPSTAPAAAATDMDLSEARLLPVDPPDYEAVGIEEAPPYESPIEVRRRSLLPRIEQLPAIEVTVSSPRPAEEEEGPTQ